MASTENWCIPCVPDNEEFEPTQDELELMYAELEKGEKINLEWKFPGRRPPTPVQVANADDKKNANTEQSSKNLEFDFMDEEATPLRVQRPISGPKSLTKKKAATFSNVLDAMKKNKRTIHSAKE